MQGSRMQGAKWVAAGWMLMLMGGCAGRPEAEIVIRPMRGEVLTQRFTYAWWGRSADGNVNVVLDTHEPREPLLGEGEPRFVLSCRIFRAAHAEGAKAREGAVNMTVALMLGVDHRRVWYGGAGFAEMEGGRGQDDLELRITATELMLRGKKHWGEEPFEGATVTGTVRAVYAPVTVKRLLDESGYEPL